MRALLAYILLVLASTSIVSAIPISKQNDIPLKLPKKLTKEELRMIYSKYNVTKNDIKFAKGELPHYLAGTILDGKVVTMGIVKIDNDRIVIKNWTDRKLHKWCLNNGYRVISAKKWFKIERKAVTKYIKKYGVDPANPKVEMVNEKLLPIKYVEKLVKSGVLKPSSGDISPTSNSKGTLGKKRYTVSLDF